MEKMLDVTFYRDAVLEIVLGGHHITREVCELRLNLFIRAANHYFKTKNVKCEVLEPFPICFYDRVTKTRRYDDLQSCIQSIPTLSEIRVCVLSHKYFRCKGKTFIYRNDFIVT